MNEIRKSLEIVVEAEQVIEKDVELIEEDCKNINCNPIKKMFYHIGKLFYDIFYFIRKCKKNN
jgi:hypothetical protein